MKKAEWINGLPFYIPSSEMEDYMTVGSLVEELIYLKKKYDICYPDDEYINLVCNVLEKLEHNVEISSLLKQMENK